METNNKIVICDLHNNCKSPFSNYKESARSEKYRVTLFLLFVHDFGVQFSDFSPQGLENVQLSFSFCVKVNFILIFDKRKKKIIYKSYL
jgi:hypothetical protein